MACQCLLAESSVKSPAKFYVDMSSAALYLEMARNAQAGDMPIGRNCSLRRPTRRCSIIFIGIRMSSGVMYAMRLR